MMVGKGGHLPFIKKSLKSEVVVKRPFFDQTNSFTTGHPVIL